jgi:hypothetical protein
VKCITLRILLIRTVNNKAASRRWLMLFLKYDPDVATREAQIKHLWIATKIKKLLVNDYFEKNESSFGNPTKLANL